MVALFQEDHMSSLNNFGTIYQAKPERVRRVTFLGRYAS